MLLGAKRVFNCDEDVVDGGYGGCLIFGIYANGVGELEWW